MRASPKKVCGGNDVISFYFLYETWTIIKNMCSQIKKKQRQDLCATPGMGIGEDGGILYFRFIYISYLYNSIMFDHGSTFLFDPILENNRFVHQH